MRIVIAPDSFKGSLSAVEASRAMDRGFRRAGITETVLIPIADGGEGTVEALCAATGGEIHTARVTGPLGAPVTAAWGILGDGMTGVVEMAAASGLDIVPEADRDALRATSYGTGELCRIAIAQGCKRMILGLGGSATTDGGAGILQALGIALLDAEGKDIARGGQGLTQLDRIDLSAAQALKGVTFQVACDVTNPLTGPEGAAAVYGPQKGATPDMVALLDKALAHFAQVIARETGRDIAKAPGAGAAGGAGGGLLGLLHAELTPGFSIVAKETQLEGQIRGANLVVTGEGRTDAQTLYGKVPVGVLGLAKGQGVPVVCLSGGLAKGYQALYGEGMLACLSTVDGPMPLQEAMARAGELIEERAFALGRMLLAFSGVR